jgi:class 3 adenylate cyclase/tetratricopeptide (TPR) repeat protein
MSFEEILDQAIALLQRRGRVTYRMLKLQFQLDDDQLAALKETLIEAERLAYEEGGKILVWTGGSAPTAVPSGDQARVPQVHTPSYLAEKILTSRSALEGERKQVTVLFADLKGSMELLAERDPEEARKLLDPVLERMMAAVHRYDGTVNQVMGDGIMALFGAPIAHEDHAVRACYAALTMQASVKQYAADVQRTHGAPLQIRVGLNAGEVVVRAIGSDLHMDYTAVGQTTHLAARVEQMAMPGSILITSEVLGLAEGYLQVTSLGPMRIQGLREPVAVYEVLGAGPVRTRLQAAVARGLTRLVGRDTEVAQLHQALERAQAGHGQVVALVGEPGIGKSRLVYECTQALRTHNWLILESQAVAYGKATPYLPVLNLLKAYFRLEDCDDARRVREKVAGKVLALDAALGSTLPALLALSEVSVEDPSWQALEPCQRHQYTLDAVKRLLLRESQVQPLLLVIEDLHWIDAETQALLDSLVESLSTARCLLLVNYRPEYQHGWGSKISYTQLRLDPLPPASAEELLQTLLGDDAGLAPLKQCLIDRTDGNPFFLEESVRALVETRVLVGEPGAFRPAQAVPTLQVPATVQAVLAARIDRRSPDEKHLLQTAAVIGTEVPFPLLQAIAELPEAALRRGLMQLQTAEFLYETRLFPELAYTFKHALTHEVAYSGLLQDRRRTVHARILEAIEHLYPDRLADQIEQLAHHALRGEVWDKALVYCRQAGAKAAARSANKEAVAYLEQALGALQHLPASHETREQAVDLRLDLRNALVPLGEVGRIFDVLREAEPLAEALEDGRRLGRVSTLMANGFLMVGDYDRAVAPSQRARALAADLGDFDLQVMAEFYLGQLYYARGDYRRALDCFGWLVTALEGDLIRERFGMPALPSVLCRSYLVRCLAEQGAFAEGSTRGEESVKIAQAIEHPYTLSYAYLGIGALYLRQGALPKAIAVLERALGLCQGADIPLGSIESASTLGYAYALSGRLIEALPLLEQAAEQAVSMRLLFSCSLWLTQLSEAYLVAGRLANALECAQRALECAQKHQERGHEAWALRLLGEIHSHREPPEIELAEAAYRQALALAQELGMEPLLAHGHFGLGTLHLMIGCLPQARTELSAAAERYRALEMTYWLPQAEAALARVTEAGAPKGREG